jgi:hypothetical protein
MMGPSPREIHSSYVLFLGRGPTQDEASRALASVEDWRDLFALLAQSADFDKRHPVFRKVLDDLSPHVVTQVPVGELRTRVRSAVGRAVLQQRVQQMYRLAEAVAPLDQWESTLGADFLPLITDGASPSRTDSEHL